MGLAPGRSWTEHSYTEAINTTPSRCPRRQTTRQAFREPSEATRRLNRSGRPKGLAVSSEAPLSVRFRTVQSNEPKPKSMAPALYVRFRRLARWSSMSSAKLISEPFDFGNRDTLGTGECGLTTSHGPFLYSSKLGSGGAGLALRTRGRFDRANRSAGCGSARRIVVHR